MVAVTLAGSHLGASLRECLHCTYAHVRLFAVTRAVDVLGYKSQQWALSTTVRLDWWQLNLYDVTFWHFIIF